MNHSPLLLLGRTILLFCLSLVLVSPNSLAQDYDKKTLQISTESETAQKHFWKGMHDANNVFFVRAAGHFAASVNADPEFALAQFMYDRFIPGLTQADRIAKLNESLDGIAKSSTAELLLATGIREQLAGNGDNARALYAATADLVPDDPNVAYYLASITGGGGSAERIAALRDVTERFPENAAAFNILAYTLWANGNESGAREAVAKYVELEPEHPNSHDSYAELFQFSGMYGQAVKHYKKAIEIDDEYFAAYTGLSEALLLTGDADGARKALQDGYKHATSKSAKANLTRSEANTYFMQGDGATGLAKLREAAKKIEDAGNNGLAAQTHREISVAEALFGSKDNVAAHVKRAEELQEGSAGNSAWATIAYSLVGDAYSAEAAAKEFDSVTKGAPFTKTLDAIVLLANMDHNAAQQAFIESGLNNPWAKAFMARCQKEMGNMAEATSLEREIMADNQFTSNNFGYTLARLTLVDEGAGHVRAGLEQD